MKKFFQEFGAFIKRGNVIDMAVGVIIGGAFNKIITGITNDILNPLLSLIVGKTQFSDMFIILKGDPAIQTLAEAKEAGATVLAYGNIIQLILDFLLTAFCLFCIIRMINKIHERANKKKLEEEAAAKAAAEAEAAAKAAEEAAKEPELTTTEKLLTEIKELLQKK